MICKIVSFFLPIFFIQATVQAGVSSLSSTDTLVSNGAAGLGGALGGASLLGGFNGISAGAFPGVAGYAAGPGVSSVSTDTVYSNGAAGFGGLYGGSLGFNGISAGLAPSVNFGAFPSVAGYAAGPGISSVTTDTLYSNGAAGLGGLYGGGLGLNGISVGLAPSINFGAFPSVAGYAAGPGISSVTTDTVYSNGAAGLGGFGGYGSLGGYGGFGSGLGFANGLGLAGFGNGFAAGLPPCASFGAIF